MGIACVVSLVFIAGGVIWFLDILHEPVSAIHVLPAVVVLFGIGIAYVGLKVIH